MLKEIPVTARQLGEVLDLSERRISELTKVEVFQRPYQLTEAVKSYIGFLRQEKGGLSAERQRLTKLKADILELEKEQRRGELVEVAACLQQWGAVATAIRGKLLALPTKLGPQLVGLRTPALMAGKLREAIHEALAELSRLNEKDVQRLASQGKGTPK